MSNKIHMAAQAQRDLDDIAEYILFDLSNPTAAMNIVEQIVKEIDELAKFPQMGAMLSSIAEVETNYRFLVIDQYLAFYRVMGSDIYVDRILYGRRDYLRILLDTLQ